MTDGDQNLKKKIRKEMVRELEEFKDLFILVIVHFTEPINRFCLQMLYLKNDITKTCPCNIQRFFSAVKNENFIGKKSIVWPLWE